MKTFTKKSIISLIIILTMIFNIIPFGAFTVYAYNGKTKDLAVGVTYYWGDSIRLSRTICYYMNDKNDLKRSLNPGALGDEYYLGEDKVTYNSENGCWDIVTDPDNPMDGFYVYLGYNNSSATNKPTGIKYVSGTGNDATDPILFELVYDVAPTTHTVTFELNGGTMEEDNSLVVNDGDTVTEPTPTKEGFAFGGWFVDSAFTQTFDFSTSITSNKTIYAKWKALPKLLGESVWRTDSSTATLRFNSNVTGTYYYVVTNSNTTPTADSIKTATTGVYGSDSASIGINPINITGLSAGAQYVYIVVEQDGTFSNVLTIEMPYDVYYFENFEVYLIDTYISSNALTPISQIHNGTGNANQKVINNINGDGQILNLSSSGGWASDQIIMWDEMIPSTGMYVFEGDVKPQYSSDDTGWQLRFTATNGNYGRSYEAGVQFEFGKIIDNGNTVVLKDSFDNDTWYHIKLEFYPDDNTYDISIDGEKVAEGLSMPSGLNRLAITSGHGYAAYYDNLKYYVDSSYVKTSHRIVVNNGSSTPTTKAEVNSTVTITADEAPSGAQFYKWEVVSGGITLADENSATTTFTMGTENVEVTARYIYTIQGQMTFELMDSYGDGWHGNNMINIVDTSNNNTIESLTLSSGSAFIGTTQNLEPGHIYDLHWQKGSYPGECGFTLKDKDGNVLITKNGDYCASNEGVFLTIQVEEVHTHNLTLVPAKDATCSATGNNAYYTCSGCDKVFTDALGTVETTVEAQTIAINPNAHDWDSGIVTTPATCTSEGVKTYTCNHNHEHTKTEPVDKIAHELVHIDELAATCTADGNDGYYKCSVCDKYFTDALGTSEIVDKTCVVRTATGHTWGEWTVTTPATEDSVGEETRICENDSTHTETRETPKLTHTHTLVKTDEVPANCKTTGTEEYWSCSGCHKMFSDSEGTNEIDAPITIAKIAHSWNDGEITTPATCLATGVKTYTCTVCGETKTETIAKKSHTLETIVAIAPTCETDGIKTHHKCSECNKLFADTLGTVEITSEDIIDSSTGHDWGDWVETTPATVDEEGVKTRICKKDSSHKEATTIDRLPYAILEGDNQTFVIDSSKDISIKANGTFNKFLGLKMDGKDIESKFYTAVSGSTVVTLAQEYLDTLDEGEHILTFVYTDGTVDSTLKIAKTSTPEEINNNQTNTETTNISSSPKTGDNIIIWISLLVVSALGVMTTIRFIKKKA